MAFALLLAGCAKEYDDSALTARVDKLESDVKTLATQIKTLNEQVSGLQTAIDEWRAGGYITDISVTTDANGRKTYTITFVGGKTVTLQDGEKGAKGDKGDPGNPGSNGSNGSNGQDGHTPVVSIKVDTDGVAYWAVDGEFILVGGNKVPVYGDTPTFAVNAEGHLIMTVGETQTDLGLVAGVGTGVVIEDLEDYVQFTLADNSVIQIPKAKAFKLTIKDDVTSFEAAAGSTVTVNYDVQNADASTTVNTFANCNDYKVVVDESAKTIKVTIPDPFVPAEVLVWAQNEKGLNSLVKLSFWAKADLVVVTEATSYEAIDRAGGSFIINLTSNVDVTVETPEVDWVTAVVTKAAYKLELTLLENTTGDPREAAIKIKRVDNGQIIQTINIIQLGGAAPAMPDAAVGDILWAEDWTGGEANKTPADYGQEGTTVFEDYAVTYASVKPSSGSDIKIYVDNQMDGGGNQENLLLSKNGGTWTISGIPTGNAKAAVLAYALNSKRNHTVTSPTEGVTIGTRVEPTEASKPYHYSYPISFDEGVTRFTLVFTCNDSNNIRVDDVELKVSEAGGETHVPVVKVEKLWEKLSTTEANWMADFGGTAGTDFNIAIDDKNVYVAEFGDSKKIWAISIAESTSDLLKATAVENSTIKSEGFDGSFFLSCARVIKKNDGSPVLLVSNLSTGTTGWLYAYDNGIDAAPTIYQLDQYSAGRRLGDTFSVYGTYEKAMLIFATHAEGANGFITFQLPGNASNVCGLWNRYAISLNAAFEGYWPFPGELTRGMFGKRKAGDDGYRSQYMTIDATEQQLWDTSSAAFTATTSGLDWLPSAQNFSGVAYNYVEFNGKRYVIYGSNTVYSGASGTLMIKEAEAGTDWQTILNTDGLFFSAPLNGTVSTGWKGGMDVSAFQTDDAVYIAVNKMSTGIAVYKMYLE